MSDEQPPTGGAHDEPTRVMPGASVPPTDQPADGFTGAPQQIEPYGTDVGRQGGAPAWAWIVIGLLVVLIGLVAFSIVQSRSDDTTTTTSTTTTTTVATTSSTAGRPTTTARVTTTTHAPTTEKPTTPSTTERPATSSTALTTTSEQAPTSTR